MDEFRPLLTGVLPARQSRQQTLQRALFVKTAKLRFLKSQANSFPSINYKHFLFVEQMHTESLEKGANK